MVVRLELGLRSDLGSLFFLSLSLSLFFCAWVRKWFEVKIWTETNFRIKPTKTHGQLKITSKKFIFHTQPNTCIYGKAFSKVIWSQNKHNLNVHPFSTSKTHCLGQFLGYFLDQHLKPCPSLFSVNNSFLFSL